MTPLQLFLKTRYGRGPQTREALLAAQEAGFSYIRQKVMPLSPFHARYAEAPMQDWPILHKQALMQHFTRINTKGIRYEEALQLALKSEEKRDFSPMIGDVAVGLSTGTSGQRGLFMSDRHERGLWAALMMGRFLPSLWRREKIAFFLRSNNQLYESLSMGLISFEFYDLLTPFDELVTRLIKARPSVLIAPAQILGLLAKAKVPIHPRKVISVAEVLSPEDKTLIENAFSVPLDQVYQCTEGVLGMTCRAGHLHLNEAFIHIEREVIDPNTGAFHPILTDLTRRSLPILRYRLDDVLVPAQGVCPCGCVSLRLQRIEGRADDIIYWKGLGGGQKMIPSDALRQAVALASAGVSDYRLQQWGADRLAIWLETAQFNAAKLEVSENLAAQAQAYGAILPQLSFHHGLPLESDKKRRRIVQMQPRQSLS